MFSIMEFSLSFGHFNKFQSGNFEAAAFKTGNDFTDKIFSYSIRFYKYESLLH